MNGDISVDNYKIDRVLPLIVLSILMVSFTRNIYLTGLMLLIGVILNEKVVYWSLIIFSIISGAISYSNDTTILKFIILLYFMIFIRKIAKGEIKKIPKGYLVVLLIIILIYMIINSSINVLFNTAEYMSNYSFFSETLINGSRIILAIFICIDFSNQELNKLNILFKDILFNCLISSFFICIFSYFIGRTSYSHYGLERIYLTQSDPNEFACSLSIIIAISIYFIASKSNLFLKIISFGALLLTSFIIVNTLSRSGMIVEAFTIFISILMFAKGMKNKIRLIIIFSIFCLIAAAFFIDVNTILSRFSDRTTTATTGLGKYTTGRADFWLAGIEYTFKHNWLFGTGTEQSEIYINKLFKNEKAVMHNAYVELLTTYGITGIILSFIYIVKIIKGFLRNKSILHNNMHYYVSLMMLLSLLLAAASLSWAYNVLIWIIIGINAGVLGCINLNKIERGDPAENRTYFWS